MNPLLRILPRSAQRRLLLRHVRLDRTKLENLRLYLAESEADLRGAMCLVHDVYASKGIINTQKTGLHITKHNVLPSSLVFVAKEKTSGRIVGTTTLVRDEAILGLPMDATHDAELDAIRAQGVNLAEFVTTACDIDYRGSGLNFFLYRLALHTALKARIQMMVMRIHPRARPLYEELLVCERLGDERYDPALNNKPAAGLCVEVPLIAGRMLERFGSTPSERNPYTIFFGSPIPEIDVPTDVVASAERVAASAALVKMRPDLFSMSEFSQNPITAMR